MRTMIAAMMASILAAAPAMAQAPMASPPAAAVAVPLDPILSVTSAEVEALIARARAEIKPGAPSINLPFLRLMPYRANLEYRVASTPYNSHLHDAEFIFVVAGSGS